MDEPIVSHHLEGLEPDAQTIEYLKRVVRGELGIEKSCKGENWENYLWLMHLKQHFWEVS